MDLNLEDMLRFSKVTPEEIKERLTESIKYPNFVEIGYFSQVVVKTVIEYQLEKQNVWPFTKPKNPNVRVLISPNEHQLIMDREKLTFATVAKTDPPVFIDVKVGAAIPPQQAVVKLHKAVSRKINLLNSYFQEHLYGIFVPQTYLSQPKIKQIQNMNVLVKPFLWNNEEYKQFLQDCAKTANISVQQSPIPTEQ